MYTLTIHYVKSNEDNFRVFNIEWTLRLGDEEYVHSGYCDTEYGAKFMAKDYIKKLNKQSKPDKVFTLNEKGKVVK